MKDCKIKCYDNIMFYDNVSKVLAISGKRFCQKARAKISGKNLFGRVMNNTSVYTAIRHKVVSFCIFTFQMKTTNISCWCSCLLHIIITLLDSSRFTSQYDLL